MTCFLKPLPLMLLRFLHSGAHLISMHLYHQVQIRPVEMTVTNSGTLEEPKQPKKVKQPVTFSDFSRRFQS